MEQFLIHLLVWVRITIINIEELRDSCAMMRGNEVLDDAWDVGFLGEFQSFRHMADDDLGTLQVGELVVWVDASLVLREEDWVHHLADVMIQGSCTYQETVGMDAVGYLCRQVAHRDGVLEGAWGYLTQVAKQTLVGVRQLKEGDVGDESEEFLDEVHQWIGEQEEDAIDGEIGVHVRVDVEYLCILHQLQCEIDHATRYTYQEGGDEYLRTLAQFTQ